jgi:hypothetical protein
MNVREELPALLVRLSLTVEVRGFCFVGETPELFFLAVMVQPDIPNLFPRRIGLTQ